MSIRQVGAGIIALAMTLSLGACTADVNIGTNSKPDDSKQQTFGTKGTELRIASGSENKEVADAIRKAAETAGVKVTIDYMGSLDIMNTLENNGTRNGVSYDGVWPANSMWAAMGDKNHIVKDMGSTSTTPVIFGVAKSKAEQLGWVDTDGKSKQVSTTDILNKVQSGELKFSMTSATQSNSGASAYLAFLNALSGSTDPIDQSVFTNRDITGKVKTILSGVDRSSGSSDWLKDMIVAQPERFDAMVNYESLVIQANKQLTAKGKDPLIAIYPSDGIAISDSPLGYVERNQGKETDFLNFQRALSSNQSKLLFERAGRRTGLGGMLANPNDSEVKASFNPEWGIDTSPDRLKSITMPTAATIRKALDVYQTELRKPSWTVWVVDYSGSMNGEGKDGVIKGMNAALNLSQARSAGIAPTSQDVNIFIPFDSKARESVKATGTNTSRLLNQVNREEADGGTNIYDGLTTALDNLPTGSDQHKYTTAIALLTDGQSETWDRAEAMKAYKDKADGIPIFPIMFGDASQDQLDDLANMSNGKVFDGRSDDLTSVFRTVKGYN